MEIDPKRDPAYCVSTDKYICHFCDHFCACDLFEDENSRIACCETCFQTIIAPIYLARNGGEEEISERSQDSDEEDEVDSE